MRYEFKEEVNNSIVIKRVSSLQTNSNHHMSYSQNDCHLHFESIEVLKSITALIPFIVYSKRINTIFLQTSKSRFKLNSCSKFSWSFKTRITQLKWNWHEVVIKKPNEEWEKSHQSYDVSQVSNRFHIRFLHKFCIS